jgi:hypothetical protein
VIKMAKKATGKKKTDPIVTGSKKQKGKKKKGNKK